MTEEREFVVREALSATFRAKGYQHGNDWYADVVATVIGLIESETAPYREAFERVRTLLEPWRYDEALDCVPAKEDQGYYERMYVNGPDAFEVRKALEGPTC